ncbi:hypothetical protein SAMN05421504_11129 [Amycolatopsis xylanica]|uniref:DUF5709 domain-containing protein n=1 Tax=Amycolatopsis xylanica TaxID=589385 RepID=A0A1H3RF14_9PSEU|nr:hypothetical protein SAMN05421504_11129 [Amycolatopsis xylanica]
MTEPSQPYDAPQDTGAPDSVETDPAALTAAEDLDEDRLRVDPLDEGMDPPEHWSGVTKHGMTPWEEAHPRPLGERLAEERPDPVTELALGAEPSEEDAADQRYAEDTGISADVAGGSMAAEIREPPRMSTMDTVDAARPFGSEQQERLELDRDPEPGGLDSRAWDRDDPDATASSREPVQLRPVEGDGPPVDTEPDEVAVEAGPALAAGPEQAALHVEDEH